MVRQFAAQASASDRSEFSPCALLHMLHAVVALVRPRWCLCGSGAWAGGRLLKERCSLGKLGRLSRQAGAVAAAALVNVWRKRVCLFSFSVEVEKWPPGLAPEWAFGSG